MAYLHFTVAACVIRISSERGCEKERSAWRRLRRLVAARVCSAVYILRFLLDAVSYWSVQGIQWFRGNVLVPRPGKIRRARLAWLEHLSQERSKTASSQKTAYLQDTIDAIYENWLRKTRHFCGQVKRLLMRGMRGKGVAGLLDHGDAMLCT